MEDKYRFLKDLGFSPPNFWRDAYIINQFAPIIVNMREFGSNNIEQLKDVIYARFASAAATLENSLPDIKARIQRGESLLTPFVPDEDPELLERKE